MEATPDRGDRERTRKPLSRHPSTWIGLLLLIVLLLWRPSDLGQPSAGMSFDCVPDAPYPCVAPDEAGLDPAVLARFMDRVDAWVADGDLVGAELLVVKDRRIAWHTTVGWSDRERELPLARNSLYRIRSMTKPFVGTTVLLLAEEGRLELDDRVADHLPSFDNDRSGSITVRQLLTHGTGFEQTDFPGGYWEQANLREAIRLVGQEGPPNPPGERYRYADRNSATLGAIVAELTGARVEEELRRRIFEPLDLEDTHTHFSPDSAWADRMNSTYSVQEGRLQKYWDNTQPQQTPWFRASGGIYTTVFDYARWLEVWMDRGAYEGGRLLAEETVAEALTPGYAEGYGLHWELFSGSAGGTEVRAFGHGGSDGTFALAVPDLDVMILFFTQSRGARGPWGEAMRELPSLVGLEMRLR
jgi:CubicO group peptidase (beta-lactamase class C family)